MVIVEQMAQISILDKFRSEICHSRAGGNRACKFLFYYLARLAPALFSPIPACAGMTKNCSTIFCKSIIFQSCAICPTITKKIELQASDFANPTTPGLRVMQNSVGHSRRALNFLKFTSFINENLWRRRRDSNP